MRVHHTITKAIAKAGASIQEINGEFVLTHDELALRATSNDARELRALAQQWAEGENIESYQIEDLIAEDDDARTGSVVHSNYKKAYKEAGHPGNCGDWLATVLRNFTHDGFDEFQLDRFTAIAEMNGVNDWAKYDRGDAGSRGRIVMNCSNRLRTIVKKTGVLRTPNGDMTPEA